MPTRTIPLTSIDRLAANLFSSMAPRVDRQIPVDAFQHDGGLVLQFDLPGVSEDTVELTIERRVLSVRAERPYGPGESDRVLIAERPWGVLSRQIVLGDTLDSDRITATFDQGVLTVTVPLAANAQSRRVEITHAPMHTSEIAAESTDVTDASQN